MLILYIRNYQQVNMYLENIWNLYCVCTRTYICARFTYGWLQSPLLKKISFFFFWSEIFFFCFSVLEFWCNFFNVRTWLSKAWSYMLRASSFFESAWYLKATAVSLFQYAALKHLNWCFKSKLLNSKCVPSSRLLHRLLVENHWPKE